jgi:hypothetical protein
MLPDVMTVCEAEPKQEPAVRSEDNSSAKAVESIEGGKVVGRPIRCGKRTASPAF